MLDFCAVAEYFEEKYDYSLPLRVPRVAKDKKDKGTQTGEESGDGVGAATEETGGAETAPETPARNSRCGRARTS